MWYIQIIVITAYLPLNDLYLSYGFNHVIKMYVTVLLCAIMWWVRIQTFEVVMTSPLCTFGLVVLLIQLLVKVPRAQSHRVHQRVSSWWMSAAELLGVLITKSLWTFLSWFWWTISVMRNIYCFFLLYFYYIFFF